jgi:hypothetical protein
MSVIGFGVENSNDEVIQYQSCSLSRALRKLTESVFHSSECSTESSYN